MRAVDPLKPLLPKAWQAEPYFRKLDALVGVPVINVHMCARDEMRLLCCLPQSSSGVSEVIFQENISDAGKKHVGITKTDRLLHGFVEAQMSVCHVAVDP